MRPSVITLAGLKSTGQTLRFGGQRHAETGTIHYLEVV